jgi:nitrile hydratase accessory protein
VTAPLPVDGPEAPPRANGELVFAEPWQSRAFGMAVILHDAGMFAWDDFRSALIRHIAAADGQPGGQGSAVESAQEGAGYYDHWLAALQDTLARARIVSVDELTERSRKLGLRPHGHDH